MEKKYQKKWQKNYVRVPAGNSIHGQSGISCNNKISTTTSIILRTVSQKNSIGRGTRKLNLICEKGLHSIATKYTLVQ